MVTPDEGTQNPQLMKKRTPLKSFALIAFLGFLTALTLTACKSDNAEHPAGAEHPKKAEHPK